MAESESYSDNVDIGVSVVDSDPHVNERTASKQTQLGDARLQVESCLVPVSVQYRPPTELP